MAGVIAALAMSRAKASGDAQPPKHQAFHPLVTTCVSFLRLQNDHVSIACYISYSMHACMSCAMQYMAYTTRRQLHDQASSQMQAWQAWASRVSTPRNSGSRRSRTRILPRCCLGSYHLAHTTGSVSLRLLDEAHDQQDDFMTRLETRQSLSNHAQLRGGADEEA